jgi:uncharacterized phage protein (TIGR02220 family)
MKKHMQEDFKKEIDLKAAECLKDPRMSKFLRPETLFGINLNGISTRSPLRKP